MPEVVSEGAEPDFARLVRPGDLVLWGQACAEPRTLTEGLFARRAEIGGFRCFLGIPVSDTVRPDHADRVSFLSYCGSGSNRALHRTGALDVVPVHYSQLPDLLSTGPLRADVVLLQLSPPDASGRYSLGLGADYLRPAIGTARVVMAEVNDRVPWTHGGPTLTDADLDVVVRVSRPPAEFVRGAATEADRRIGHLVASLIDDGATLQLGLGGIPEAVLARLTDRRDLGIHSGQIGDTVAGLMEAGIITNRRKSVDAGVTVTGLLMGSERLFRYAHRNPAIEVRETGRTHDPAVLAAQERFVAINSAVEVDLTGQVNAEVVRGSYVGAVGGAMDFLRGAARSRGGLPVVALPSTAGPAGRIVARLSGPVSTPRADAGVVVTEYGIADLRGLPLRQRRERMLALAHPDHRPGLETSIEEEGCT